MAYSHIIMGKAHGTTARVMVPTKTIFSWGAGVAHGGAQWEQKSLRISILRCEITRQKKRVNRTLVTINKSSYIHQNLGSRGRPTYFDLYNDKISVKKTPNYVFYNLESNALNGVYSLFLM